MSESLARSLRLVGQQHPLVKVAQDAEDARELGNDGAPTRLGRMGRQNEANLGIVQELSELRGVDPVARRGDALPP